jgi:hypothetical protein
MCDPKDVAPGTGCRCAACLRQDYLRFDVDRMRRFIQRDAFLQRTYTLMRQRLEEEDVLETLFETYVAEEDSVTQLEYLRS